jgi:hypothetical protein
LFNAQNLIDKINLFASKNKKPNEFDIRLLKKDVNELKDKAGHALYYDFLGKIAALEHKKSELIEFHEKSITLLPDDIEIQYDYIMSLNRAGLFYQALEHSKEVLVGFPDNEIFLIAAINNSFSLCRFREAFSFFNRLKNKTSFSEYKTLQKGLAIFEDVQLSDDEAENLHKLAFSMLESHGLYYSASEINIICDCVCYSIYIDLPVEAMAEINWELAGLFVENVEDIHSDVFTFEYESVEVLEERIKYERSV